MENNIIETIYSNYGINIKNLQILSGGWMNQKYVGNCLNGDKYVIKIFSSKKVEKMSNGEFSSDYLDNQLLNNLKVENNMNLNKLKCEHIEIDKKNRILLPYDDDRLAVMRFLNGNHVSRESINYNQLYNLGLECAKMHYMFRGKEHE